MQIRILTLAAFTLASLAAAGCAERRTVAVSSPPAAAPGPRPDNRFYTPSDAVATPVGQPVQPTQPSYAYGPNTPVPGARPPRTDTASQVPTQVPAGDGSAYNSDNRPTYTRSGINSDPSNPNGAPGPATPTDGMGR